MKKYLIFAMLLLAVLACKPKQKPGVRGVIDGGGGYITPPSVQTKDEATILDIFTNSIAKNYDRTSDGWQKSDWKDTPRLRDTDLGKITDGGFFVSQYSTENWIVLAVTTNRNVYIGLSKGAGNLQEALDMLADKDGKLREESWDPRKLVYNQVADFDQNRNPEDPERLLSIAWLGRALWDGNYADQENTSYRDYDSKYANALKYLNGDAKTYGTLRKYRNTKYLDFIFDAKLKQTEARSWGYGETFPLEEALGDEPRKVWGYFLFDPNNRNHITYKANGPRFQQGNGITRASSASGMRFCYADKEGGWPGGASEFDYGTRGTKAIPKGATWDDRQPGGKYYDGYNAKYPRGKIVLDREPINPDPSGKARVLLLNSVVGFNLRMRPAQDKNAGALLGEKYSVSEVIIEFDADSFKDVTGDKFAADDLPIRQGIKETDEIIETPQYKTHKMPMLYFSPK